MLAGCDKLQQIAQVVNHSGEICCDSLKILVLILVASLVVLNLRSVLRTADDYSLGFGACVRYADIGSPPTFI